MLYDYVSTKYIKAKSLANVFVYYYFILMKTDIIYKYMMKKHHVSKHKVNTFLLLLKCLNYH